MGGPTNGFFNTAYSAYQSLPPKAQQIIQDEGMNLATEAYQYGKAQLKQSFAQQQESAKRSRSEAYRAQGPALDASVIVPAQFAPGRGAELSFQRQNILNAIRFKTGESSGPRAVNAYGREAALYKGQVAAHAFAFKMQLTPPSYVSTSDSVPVNRFVVHNVFRHVLDAVQNVNLTSTAFTNVLYGRNSTTWNQTLGPDKSYVRQVGQELTPSPAGTPSTTTGSAYVATGSGLNNTLQSPFRYPRNGDFMYTRMSRKATENLGWNANPMKICDISPGTAGVTPITVGSLAVYHNAPLANGTTQTSFPNVSPPSTVEAGTNHTAGASYYYRSQQGKGQVSYNFNNDGTNPIVVDIVITRLKKNEAKTKAELQDQMIQVYQQGYLNYSYANSNQCSFQGQPPQAVDVTTNARGPFLPAKALSHYKVTTTSGAVTADSSNSFKQIARDQFIISAGSTRSWSMPLQAIDYDARKYAQFISYNPIPANFISADDAACSCVDDLSYIVSIAISGVPAPFIEAGTGLSAVIDRRGTDASCSVTGMFKEVCHPVYISMVDKTAYVNGRLDVPHYDSGQTLTTLATQDIANIGQATRGSANSSALISMGPLSTVGGA